MRPDSNSRRKKIQITSQRIGYPVFHYPPQQNPYSLSKSPSTPVLSKRISTASKNSNQQTITQNSSNRSNKMVRKNVLSKVQKPNISGSRVLINRGSGRMTLGDPYNSRQNNYRLSENSSVLNEYGKVGYKIENSGYMEIVNENNLLKRQKNGLIKDMRQMQQRHRNEVAQLNNKFMHINNYVNNLEHQIQQHYKQYQKWKNQHHQ